MRNLNEPPGPRQERPESQRETSKPPGDNPPGKSRLPSDHPRRDEILARHREAMAAGQAGYLDPATGLFVLTAKFLADRGYCCTRGCRHCPYVDEAD